MRGKNLHLDGRAVCLQVLQSRKQPLQRVWINKMSSFAGLELQKNTKIHARRGYAVHQRRAKPMVHAARAAKNTKRIGRRPSRCDIGAVRVRWLPHFSPGASRNSIRAAIPQISLLSQTVFFQGITVFGGGVFSVLWAGCCTSEARETDGARGARGEKYETNRTPTIQM